MTPDDPDLVTTTAAARLLTVTRQTVWKLVKRGKLHVFYVTPTTARLSRREVLSYLESSQGDATRKVRGGYKPRKG